MVDRSDVIDRLSVSTREEIGPLFANRLIPTDVAVRSAAVFVNIVETIPLAANREFTYFGGQFSLESLPDGVPKLAIAEIPEAQGNGLLEYRRGEANHTVRLGLAPLFNKLQREGRLFTAK